MKKAGNNILFGLGFCFFCGYVIISVGLGSVWPTLYKAATPIICKGDQSLEVETATHTWRPGTAMFTAKIYRVGGGFGKEEVTSRAKLAAGAVYGLALFLLFLPKLLRKSKSSSAESTASTSATATGPSSGASRDTKLAELKKLHDEKLITDEDYEQKKADILKEI